MMWVEVMCSATANVASATLDTDKKTHKMFCGWIAFCLYGPHVPEEMQLDILKLVDRKYSNETDKTNRG